MTPPVVLMRPLTPVPETPIPGRTDSRATTG